MAEPGYNFQTPLVLQCIPFLTPSPPLPRSKHEMEGFCSFDTTTNTPPPFFFIHIFIYFSFLFLLSQLF